MTREKEYYRTKIEQDSTLLERLQYDDYLEEYAARITTCSGAANMSILSRNKFFAGRRLPESRKCGGLRAAVFFCYGLRGTEMFAEGRNAG